MAPNLMLNVFYIKAILITSHFRPRDSGPEGMEPDGIIEVGDS